MTGPKPRGYWSNHQAPNCGLDHGLFRSGGRYRVAAEFVDFDGDHHRVGEEWEFLSYCFLPHEDGMSLFVAIDSAQEWLIPLQWHAGQQEDVLKNLEVYFQAAT